MERGRCHLSAGSRQLTLGEWTELVGWDFVPPGWASHQCAEWSSRATALRWPRLLLHFTQRSTETWISPHRPRRASCSQRGVFPILVYSLYPFTDWRYCRMSKWFLYCILLSESKIPCQTCPHTVLHTNVQWATFWSSTNILDAARTSCLCHDCQ